MEDHPVIQLNSFSFRVHVASWLRTKTIQVLLLLGHKNLTGNGKCQKYDGCISSSQRIQLSENILLRKAKEIKLKLGENSTTHTCPKFPQLQPRNGRQSVGKRWHHARDLESRILPSLRNHQRLHHGEETKVGLLMEYVIIVPPNMISTGHAKYLRFNK